MVPDPVYIGVTDPPSGVTGLLAGAIGYMLGVCALVRPGAPVHRSVVVGQPGTDPRMGGQRVLDVRPA